MKLNIDLGYVLKRVVVIVMAFVIIQCIKSCEVFAASPVSYTLSPSYCYHFYTGALHQGTPTTSSSVSFGTGSYYYCNVSGSNNWVKSMFYFSLPSSATYSYGTYSFSIYGANVSNAILRSGGVEYPCVVNTGVNVSNTNDLFFSVMCPNAIHSSGRSVQLELYKANSSLSNVYVSSNFIYISNDDISSSINNQSSQQHTDSENTQNAINNVDDSLNDSSIDSNTQNANGLFDTDSNGQPINGMLPSYGIETIITGPLRILQRSTESCSPVSFTIFSKSISLPCGDSLFWSRDFSSQQSIFTSGVSGSGLNTTRDNFRMLWNLLFGGAIIFHLLLKLYDVIQKAVDPMSDEYESISSAIDTSDKSPVLKGFEEVDMSDVQRNLNLRSIKNQSSQDAIVLGSLNKGV